MQILSRINLYNLVLSQPGQHSAVIIHEYGKYDDVAEIVMNCKKSLVLEMDDIVSDRAGSPTKQQVESAIKSGFDIVACKQGISRSSAIAFLIQCSKSSPEEAIRILDSKRHFPNELILKHGMEVLGEEMKPYIKQFYMDLAKNRGWKWQPHNLATKFFKD